MRGTEAGSNVSEGTLARGAPLFLRTPALVLTGCNLRQGRVSKLS